MEEHSYLELLMRSFALCTTLTVAVIIYVWFKW
jgi:hypothetical protein